MIQGEPWCCDGDRYTIRYLKRIANGKHSSCKDKVAKDNKK
jgi:hypothetical protein